MAALVGFIPLPYPYFGHRFQPTTKGSIRVHDAAKLDAESMLLTSSKPRLQTLECLDGRTRAAVRARFHMKTFEAALGGKPSPGQKLAIRRAGMLVALEEDAVARQLSGQTTDADQLVRISNLARRAIIDLHLPKADKHQGLSLADHLRQRAAERASASTESDAL
jgi:hypothetical protein